MDTSATPNMPVDSVSDPYARPMTPLGDRVRRGMWNLCYRTLFRLSPRVLFGWRVAVLRLFGATMGPGCKIYPKAKIWAPWKLVCEDLVAFADDVEIYNPSPMFFGSHAIVSQGAYVCGATHLYNETSFRLVSFPMRFGAYSWICARAMVSPGVNVGEGAILGLGSVATKDLEPFGIYAGSPARLVKQRDWPSRHTRSAPS
ncbi:MAG: putative colanic acid biosynthesis acetyltransferase [Silvibacterium sp.]